MGTTTIVDGVVASTLVFLSLLDDDVAVLALPPEEGVACWRRHSSGLRWSSDSANPRVKNRAWGEPARRVACGSNARASFS